MWWSDAPFPPKALQSQPQGWCSGKLTSPVLPPTRVSSQELQTVQACGSSQEKQLRNSFFSVIHFTFLNAEHKILTVVFSLGKAQCWCNNANSQALTWQCLNLNASLNLKKTSWETAGTSFCANLLPPEPYYRVRLASVLGWGKEKTAQS